MIPGRDDPARVLHLAIRSSRVLGVCSAGFGLLVVLMFGYFNRYERYRLHFIALGLVVWLVPGVLLLTCAASMRQRRRLGGGGALAVAGGQGVMALGALAANFMLSPISLIPVLLCCLWLTAVAQVVVQVWQSLPLLQRASDRRPGFEVTTPSKVLPLDEE